LFVHALRACLDNQPPNYKEPAVLRATLTGNGREPRRSEWPVEPAGPNAAEWAR
jgi:hypothetical protein